MRQFGALLLLALTAASTNSADIPTLIQRVNSVGKEGAGNSDAALAWKELSRLPADNLPQLLAAFDDASPAAANWLRSAIEVIVERERSAGRAVSAVPLEAFLGDVKHNGRARRFAFELLCSADPTASKRLLPAMINDPSAELRCDAVAVAFTAACQLSKESAEGKAALRKLLSTARDGKQIEDIAKELERRGDKVDLVAHFGFITRWQIAGVFDNAAGKGFTTAFDPENGVELSAKYVGKNKSTVTWLPHETTDKAGIVDLNQIFPDPNGARDRRGKAKGQKAAVAYAYAEVDSPAERIVEVRAASSPALKVFVNGREVLARESYHQSFDRDSHVGSTKLKQGRNAILVKVCQNDQPEDWAQNWMFQLRLTDELGAAVPCAVTTPGTMERPR